MKRLSSLTVLLVLYGVVLVAVIIVSGNMQTRAGPFADDRITNVPALRELPPPNNDTTLTQHGRTLCLRVYTGTITSKFTISNPNGVSGFNNYHLVNFDQRLLSQSPTTMEIEITSQCNIDTRALYPVDSNMLPDDVRGYLFPEPGIQSDDPQIVAKANELVSNTATQVEAMDAIQTWVGGNIGYDYTFSLPGDASSVFRNRSGICSGYANLIVALLRASGIPARVRIGCVAKWGWGVGDEGGRHAWIEVYLPDMGWVASDPQATANFVDTSHMFGGFDQCGQTGTIITRTSYKGGNFLYELRTPYSDSPRWYLQVAQIPAWDRQPLRVMPSSLHVTLPVAKPIGSLTLQVENLGCCERWLIITDASWLYPIVVEGTGTGTALFSIDATGMNAGFYNSTMTLSPASWPESPIPNTVNVNVDLWLVDELYQLYFPIIVKKETQGP